MAKPAKAAPAPAEAPAKPKSKKLLLIIIGVLILGIAGGAGWYFTMGNKHADEPKKAIVEEPTFLIIDPFTVNLQREESDQFLQIGITLKVASMEFADKIRQAMPEVRSRLLFLLSSKRASELTPLEGKKKLSQEIISEINSTLGLKAAPPKSNVHESAAPGGETASGVEAASAVAAPVEAAHEAHGVESSGGIQDVLFTSFIIQ
jgi:flagellar FliL protein